MTKREIRKIYKQKRQNFSENEIKNKSIAIVNALIPLHIWKYTYYHLYLSIRKQKEICTDFLLHLLQGKDKQIVIGKCDFEDYTLDNYLLTDATLLKENSLGIPEPIEGIRVPTPQIQVVFVPLLVFDTYGNRVGYGKGFYDRFLSKCNKNTIKIGMSFFEPVIQVKDIKNHDIALDIGVTPNKVYTW